MPLRLWPAISFVPVEFFVGTGDINSAFLPQQKSSIPDLPAVVPPEESKAAQMSEQAETDEEIRMRRQIQEKEIEKQLECRPLAKAQASLDKSESSSDSSKNEETSSSENNEVTRHHPILNNDDAELERLEAILVDIHQRFYEQYDAKQRHKSIPAPDISVNLIPDHLIF